MSQTDLETVAALLAGIECDDLEYQLEELREGIEDARRRRWERENPVYTCRNLLAKPLTLSQFDALLVETYAPAMREHLSMHSEMLKQLGIKPPVINRRYKVRRWIRRHTPHLRSPITWGY